MEYEAQQEISWGLYLRTLRLVTGFSLIDMGSALGGSSKQAVHAREISIQQPTLEMLKRYSNATGIPLEDIQARRIPEEVPWKPNEAVVLGIKQLATTAHLFREAAATIREQAGMVLQNHEPSGDPISLVNALTPLQEEGRTYDGWATQTDELLSRIRHELAELTSNRPKIPTNQILESNNASE